jgi:purine nucleosidase
MGGGLPPKDGSTDTPIGNIDTGIAIGTNPNAEWNAYWDPYAVDTVFRSGMTIRLFPLNVTNDYALDTAFFKKYIYPNKTYPMIDLAGQMYSTVAFETGYCFWDTVTTAYLGKPELFSFEPERLVINTDFTSPDFGSITKSPSGSIIQVAQGAERVEAFYEYYVEQLKSVAL